MSSHSKAAKRFVADAERMAWHDKALYAVREKRDRMMETVPEWEELRQLSSEIKRHTLSRLGDYLLEFERNATANGIAVHWARDAAEMNDTVCVSSANTADGTSSRASRCSPRSAA